jgi:hypothetical protein
MKMAHQAPKVESQALLPPSIGQVGAFFVVEMVRNGLGLDLGEVHCTARAEVISNINTRLL